MLDLVHVMNMLATSSLPDVTFCTIALVNPSRVQLQGVLLTLPLICKSTIFLEVTSMRHVKAGQMGGKVQ
jgi:hypothetical protein